jgi:hypothetical protein
MAQVRPLIHSFSAGEISKATLARVDQEKAKLWAEVQENLLPFAIGKASMRPGTTYLGASASNNQARGLEFVKSIEATACLELTNQLLRVWVDDALVTRPSVTSTVTNGDFSSSVGWTQTTTGDAVSTINSTVPGGLWMAVPYRGGFASCTRSVTTSSAGTQHALRIVVTRGPVTFRCGSTSGADDYISETELDTGEHSLAFTPTGDYHPFFSTRREPGVIVDSVTVESAGVMTISAPWTTAQLYAIQYDQSGDIVFLAHTSWQPRKIERRGDASWSLTKYEFYDGPFTSTRTSPTRLKTAAGRGNTTLTSENEFFKATHVGALFRLTHDRTDANWGLANSDVFTDAIRVTGIGTDNQFVYQPLSTQAISATFSLQRSYDDRVSGFVNTTTLLSSALFGLGIGEVSVDPGSTFDNVVHYYRFGILSTDYTSGSAVVRMAYKGDGGSGVCRVTSTSTTSNTVNIEVLDDFSNYNSYVTTWQEGEFSDRRGWPSAVAFHDGRLIWQREDKFRASESDNFEAFNLDTEGDSGSIQRDIATSGSVHQTNWLLSLSRLVVGTDGAEVPVRSDAFDTPLTPTNCAFKNASTVGSGPYSPERVDKQGFFIARSGNSVYRLRYNFEQQDYDSDDVTELHEDLGEDHEGFFEIAAQRHPQPWLWFPLGDGQAAVLLHDPKQQLQGWVRVVTDGEIESIYVLPAATEDRVYAFVKRTINGSTVRYHEKLCLQSEARGAATTKLADAGVFTVASSTAITGATHLAGETGLVAWGTSTGGISGFIGTLASNGQSGSLSCSTAGTIQLGASYTNTFVGLPYVGKYKSAKLAYGAQGGTAVMQNKIIPQVGLLLADVHKDAIKVGKDFDSLEQFQIRSDSGAVLSSSNYVVSSYDKPLQPAGGSWNTDSRVCMQVNAGHPATPLGLAMTVATNEK